MSSYIEVIRGDTTPFEITLGEDELFMIGDKLIFTVRACINSPTILLALNFDITEQSNAFSFILEPSQTENMATGAYVYDFELRRDTNVFTIIGPDTFSVKGDVTRATQS